MDERKQQQSREYAEWLKDLALCPEEYRRKVQIMTTAVPWFVKEVVEREVQRRLKEQQAV